MKKLESSLLNMALVLTLVAVVMGGILAYVNHLTEGPIAEQKEKALADGIKAVMVCNDLVVAKTDEVKQNDAKVRSSSIRSIRFRMPRVRTSVLLSRAPRWASVAT